MTMPLGIHFAVSFGDNVRSMPICEFADMARCKIREFMEIKKRIIKGKSIQAVVADFESHLDFNR